MDELIGQLTADQALAVVRRLAERGGNVAKAVAAEAKELLADIDVEEVAEDVLLALDCLDVEEIWDQAGGSRYGYTSPDEAAAEIVEQAIDPNVDQIRRYRELGMADQERSQCMGVVLGLYRYDHESESEFHDWAVDLPADLAGSLVRTWREGRPSRAAIREMKEFLGRSCPEWSHFVTRK